MYQKNITELMVKKLSQFSCGNVNIIILERVINFMNTISQTTQYPKLDHITGSW